MRQTKNAFTMIELIFVIVIIGILAAVAVPRLAETREDAKAVVCMDSIKTFAQDLTVYYTANGRLTNLSKMTNTPVNATLAERGIGSLRDDDLSIPWTVDFVCDGGYLATINYESNSTAATLTFLNASAVGNPFSLNNFTMGGVVNKGRVANIAGVGLEKANFFRTYTLSGSSIAF